MVSSIFILAHLMGIQLGTWELNGADVLIRSTANVAVYDVRYIITRTHKAR